MADKALDLQMEVKKLLIQEQNALPRSRTRSRPRTWDQKEREEIIERKLARDGNLKIYRRCCSVHNEKVRDLKRLVHYDEISENINDMLFLPYSNALIAAGQTGLYLVDLGLLIFLEPLKLIFINKPRSKQK